MVLLDAKLTSLRSIETSGYACLGMQLWI